MYSVRSCGSMQPHDRTEFSFFEIRPVEAELSHADGRTDGRTDMTKRIVAFHNFLNAPKNILGTSDMI